MFFQYKCTKNAKMSKSEVLTVLKAQKLQALFMLAVQNLQRLLKIWREYVGIEPTQEAIHPSQRF